jgi:transposase
MTHPRPPPAADGAADGGGPQPVSFDAEDYKHGNVVERLCTRMKNWRALASRFDKLAAVLRGSVVLAVIVDWLR